MKRILITGATGGMGRECAKLAAAEGYELVLADLNQAAVDNLTATCNDQGSEASGYVLDVTDTSCRSQLIAALTAEAPLDAIIHTVGVSPQMADWERIVNIDLIDTASLLQQLRPLLKPGGCALCISSMSGYMLPANDLFDATLASADPLAPDYMQQLRAMPGQPLQNSGVAYSFAKKALQIFVQNRAGDWGAEGKRLVTISPGIIDTQQGRLESAAMENRDEMHTRIALKRLGAPQDIAHTALFLVSDKASYISGCDILVDGGFIANFRRETRS